MKSWIFALIGLVSAWHYLDMTSDNRFYSVFLPFVFLLFLFTFVIKIAIKIGPNGQRSGGDNTGGGFGGYDGGDSGDC